MGCFIQLICDYAPGDMAWSELMSALAAKLPDNARLHITSVDSFDTIATGFVVAQLSLADPGMRHTNTVIFANCAPRKDRSDPRRNNEGEGLVFAILKNGLHLLVVNSGYSLSFIKPEILELWSIHVDDDGSQFRSRDNFPRVIASLADGNLSFKQHQLSPQQLIPDPPEKVIGYIDSFGNIKTTFRTADSALTKLNSGDRIKIVIGNIVRTATVATGSFNVMEGDLAFAPGSSGQARPYWEFFQRGGSAWIEFGKPAVGAAIQLL